MAFLTEVWSGLDVDTASISSYTLLRELMFLAREPIVLLSPDTAYLN